MTGYRIIDVDSHVTELPDLWTSRTPPERYEEMHPSAYDAKARLASATA